jgi:hypothetical protein
MANTIIPSEISGGLRGSVGSFQTITSSGESMVLLKLIFPREILFTDWSLQREQNIMKKY